MSTAVAKLSNPSGLVMNVLVAHPDDNPYEQAVAAVVLSVFALSQRTF